MEFNEAFERVIGHEGGYVFDKRDPGGETKYGISRRAHPDVDIAALTVESAGAIYRRDYWTPCQCDQLPAWARLHVFDAAVNSGVKQAAKWLQRAVDATPDGVIGAKTIAAARAADPFRTIGSITAQRLMFMTDLPTWPVFGRGWARRLANNLNPEAFS